jgi:sec-independent protein translocase protein TatA
MSPLFAIFGLGPMELVIVGVVVLLLFGSRLPSVMRSLGQGVTEFKKGVNGIEDDVNRPNVNTTPMNTPHETTTR